MSRSDITRRALADALEAELGVKALDRVTVTDVVGRCGISRQAFYYHFHDIYELAEWMFEREAGEVLGEGYGYGAWQESMLAILRLMRSRHDAVFHVLHVVDPTYVGSFLRRYVGELVLAIIDGECGGLDVLTADRELIARFYSAGLIEVVRAWVEDGMSEEPAALVDRMALMVQGDIPAALDRLSRRRA